MNPGSRQTSDGLGRAFLWLAALGMLVGLTLLFQSAQRSSGGLVRSSNDSGRAMVVLQRDRSGHYVAEGQINGQVVNFLVDTGATDVAIPEQTARTLGLQFGPQVAVMTAAGPVRAWRTRLDRVSVGSVSLDNVRATITRAPMEEVLLGMSFLQYFTILQQGDELIIESGGTSG
ncbi:MAG: TIGR02281 family clan AA aspartic protease [Xanthomonadales bacterium]|nr:TIGR02281 family clan AA aspartic protease [Xanthomonadales bacterium]